MAKYVPPHLRNREVQENNGEFAAGQGNLNGIKSTRHGGELPANGVGMTVPSQMHVPKGTNGVPAHSQPLWQQANGLWKADQNGYESSGQRWDSNSYGCHSNGWGDQSRDVGRGQTNGHCANGAGHEGGRASRAEGEWYHRKDGRKPHMNGGLKEAKLFGTRKCDAGINFDDYDKIPVKVSGAGADPNLKMDWFSEADIRDAVRLNVERMGYQKPTPVQKYAIPVVCSGRDVMACAQTGSGKTCAFMVPAVELLLRSGPPAVPSSAMFSAKRMAYPCVLALAPTRELTTQIFEESRKFAFDTGIRCCVVYGGADIYDQRRELNAGCDILVATPGRLHDMYQRGMLSLSSIQFLILDEADRMLDMGFEPQVRQIIEKTDMGANVSVPRQSMMFSATFPKEVQVLARDFLRDYVFITVGRIGSASELVEQMVLYANYRDKVSVLVKALADLRADGLALVFVETKKGADILEQDLYREGLFTSTIHGDRQQYERERALNSFRTGRTPILIATDVASRGLDIPNVNLVLNFDPPRSIDEYVHRIGRTGRAGRKGKGVTIVDEKVQPQFLRDLQDTIWESNQIVPPWFSEMVHRLRGGGGGQKSYGRSGKGGGRGRGGAGGHRFGGHDSRYANGINGGASAGASRNGFGGANGRPSPTF